MSINGERLAKAVRDRRAELDLTQLDVWQSGGPSNTTQTVIESGHLETLTRTTARKLDAALRWESGSARAVWDGGAPRPALSRIGSKDSAWVREQIGEAALSEDVRRRLLDVLDDERGAS